MIVLKIGRPKGRPVVVVVVVGGGGGGGGVVGGGEGGCGGDAVFLEVVCQFWLSEIWLVAVSSQIL